ncbi:hypothetical protein VSR01_17280 [Actinacidiphila sp. DG2A-62]|uniref:hypothetical protein n=1 Tax=Actinacidiphila sp. DG2A-62 TaxID=3108821 RepID=UPI002DBD1C36|nr:hypothetical protein [Actinacidiphila sp. DG2A-62]MEC3995191.1 hypothetical protein [Actinacidiphila sp. DG2A-62]
MSPTTPPKTPTVAIARILRSLGLVQGDDFRVTGEYRNGERIGTFVLALTRHTDETIAAQADEIERLAGEGPYPFRVSVRYPSGDRPMITVANYGARVRETSPTPATPPAPVEPEPAPAAPEAPAAGSVAERVLEGARERAWGRKRAEALGWSTHQAELMAVAAAVQLQYRSGALRFFPQPGYAGRRVEPARLKPLVDAGLLVISEPFGPDSKRVSVTADGREALHLWRVYRPVPVPKGPADVQPLRPLLGGELHTNQSASAEEQYRLRLAEREATYTAMEELHAWEARDERLWDVWARVQGITHRLGRSRPAGWVPTDEEIAEHGIAADLVAELRAEAERPTSRPELPNTPRPLPAPMPELTTAPDDAEQLDLFGAAC